MPKDNIISGVGAIKVLLLCNFLCTVILLFGGNNLSDQVSFYAADEKIQRENPVFISYSEMYCFVIFLM